MALIDILQRIGLTDKEAKIYLALLELKEALPSTLAKKSSVKRPTVYVILEALQKRGLVSHIQKKHILYFRALHPRLLLEDEHQKYKNLEQALPDLLTLHEQYLAIPQMSIFEGKDGLISVMEDTLTTKTELLCWANVSEAVETVLKDYYPSYIKKKVQRKIWLRGIFGYDETSLQFKKCGKKELREIYLIPQEKFPFRNEINIYDDKIAIISHSDEVGVIIQNKHIADTQRSIFELGFEYAKILEKKLLTVKDRRYLSE